MEVDMEKLKQWATAAWLKSRNVLAAIGLIFLVAAIISGGCRMAGASEFDAIGADDVLSFMHARLVDGEVQFTDGCPDLDKWTPAEREYVQRVIYHLMFRGPYLDARKDFREAVAWETLPDLDMKTVSALYRSTITREALASLYHAMLLAEREQAPLAKKPKDEKGRCDGAPDPAGEECFCRDPQYEHGEFTGECLKPPVSCNDCKKKKIAAPAPTMDMER
jgi:hypothetical protein